ncbi:unnamed protein product, partial [Oikopleura dioica]
KYLKILKLNQTNNEDSEA